MNHAFVRAIKPGALAFGLVLGALVPADTQAQMTGGPGLSSGSGAGTGTGSSSGVQRNLSGSVSGVGPQRAQTFGGGPMQSTRSARPLQEFGPGVDFTYPNDPYVRPFVELEQPFAAGDLKAPTQITNELLKSARLITSPEERSLALIRIANGARESRQLFLAHQTLEEATEAASLVKVHLVRDQRLIALVSSMEALTEMLLLQSRQIHNDTSALETMGKPEALPKGADPDALVRTARLEWKRAGYLARIIGNPTYRNQMQHDVAESMASGSASIANAFAIVRSQNGADPRIPAPAAPAPPAPAAPAPEAPATARPKPDAGAQAGSTKANQGKNSEQTAFLKIADEILVESFAVARNCDRLIWRHDAMFRIILQAADSDQFERGFELASTIENGESRAGAMLLLAEAQTRDHEDKGARESYQAAAEAVATVRQEGLRGVLAGVVISSLIDSGRFEDARKCIVLYPEQADRLDALGAVAESQGRRGAGDSAQKWIAAEVPEEFRPKLYRRVETGVLSAIDTNRGRVDPAVRPDRR